MLWHTVLLSHGQCPHEHKATGTTLIAPSKTKTWKQEGDVENKVMSSRGREYRIGAQYVIVITRKKKMQKTFQIEYKLKKLLKMK